MTKRAMVRFFLALFVLAVAMVVVGLPTAQDAYAVPCCSDCRAAVTACKNATSTPPCYGAGPCCFDQSASCYSVCVFC